MITYLEKTVSLNNLRSSGIGGQVATMLMFFMVVILVFILVTINVGSLSVKTTALSNAVDSSSLGLASQLGTRSRVIYNALDNDTKFCKSRGLLAFIGSLLFGPIGGAIGGLIDGSGFWEGFTTGFDVWRNLAGALLAGFAAGGIWGMIIFAVIDITAEIYNYHKSDKDMCNAMKEIAKNLSQLDVASQFRESAYLRVLSQVVDNPNMRHDTWDLDGDGNTEELVSEFEQEWFERTMQLARGAGELKSQVRAFITGPLADFRNYIERQMAAGGYFSRREFTYVDGILVQVARAVEDSGQGDLNYWEPGDPEPYCLPGELSDWCFDRNIHDPLDRVMSAFSSIVAIADELQETLDAGDINRLAEQWQEWIGVFYYLPGGLVNSVGDEGAGLSEDLPDETDNIVGGYYFELESLVNCGADSMYICDDNYVDMREWQDDLVHDRAALRTCHTWVDVPIYGPNPNPPPPLIITGYRQECIGDAFVDDTVCNDPCRIGGGAGVVGTVDDNLDDPDEFDEAIAAIDEIIGQIDVFNGAIEATYTALKDATEALSVNRVAFAFGDHVRYTWTDSLGDHSVEVDVDFPMPYVKETKNWKEVCLKLRNGIGTAVVKVIRKDPVNKRVRLLGWWNLFGEYRGIKRVSRSRYHYNELPQITGTR